MRSIFSFILIISLNPLVASDVDISSLVWYDGNTYYEQIGEKNDITLYFSQWEPSIDRYTRDERILVAIQLDQEFDPFLMVKKNFLILLHLLLLIMTH